MRAQSAVEGPERLFILVLDPGEEAYKAIADFANRERITGASISAIGAFEKAKLGWFDLETKRYQPIAVDEQCEVLSLIGDLAEGDDLQASLHLHAVVGLRDGRVRGGHFISGIVRPTLEVTIRETVQHLRRKRRSDLGIALINI
jgi:predicted DNA-binding protein with PD1-like motif